jgi:signal transduction histidine kinase
VLEKSMATAEANIAGNRNLLLAYGIVIFVLVGCVLWLLIVRFVTQPVRGLVQQMQRVQQGDLTARAEADNDDEIGQLAHGFNEMVASLETARRELHESHEKQIQQAGKLASIGELASGIAHEIRNPLAGIGAAVEVLADKCNGNGQYQEVAGEIHQQINRLKHTLRDLLDFARPREPEIEPCDVHEIIKPMLALVRPDAQKQRVQIIEEFADNLPPISADAQQLQQAILNVLLNAVQAMPNGGTLTVKTESRTGILPVHSGNGDRQDASPTSVLIAIRDTGIGIPRQNLEKIFSPFYTTKHRGTGLGLSITRTIIEKHHGRIAVESEAGRGTACMLEFAAGNALAAETRC